MKDKTHSQDVRERSKAEEIWRQFRRNKGAMIGVGYLLLLFIVALTIELWLPKEKVIGINVMEQLSPPSWKHLFGTDEMGRDLFWRVVYASRYSLAIGFSAVMIATLIGIPLGAVAGYYGGRLENLIMRVTDIFSAIPSVMMAIVIVAILGTGVPNLLLAIGVTAVPGFVRIARASVLTIKNEEYVEAARALGKRNAYIIGAHILPNCLSPIIVQITLRVASAIISASSLSYLGLGIKPPMPEWGALLNAGQAYIRNQSYITIFPGLAIMLTVLAFNLVGDGLRDAMDPKLKN